MPLPPHGHRWLIAIAGTLLHLCLGTIYAWSYFQAPLMASGGWSNTQVAWVFSLAICFLGLAAAWGGINLPRFGPRKLAILGGTLFGLGNLLAAAALHQRSLFLLYVGFGVIGGTGLGLGYVTPVATVARWFPDRKGLLTGMVIMGFGFGALLMSKVLAPTLVAVFEGNLVRVFLCLGGLFLAITVPCGAILRNPASADANVPGARPKQAGQVLSQRFVLMWLMFFCNIVAGIAIIAFQSPLLQELLKTGSTSLENAGLAAAGATLIAASSVCNGVGRLFWGAVSDHLGRTLTFRLLLGTQVLAFLAMANASQPLLFSFLVCYVLLCYGGGFGTMPSLVSDTFGAERMGVLYGTILTAWSAAGLAGPQVIAWLKDYHPQHAGSIASYSAAGMLILGLLLSFGVTDKRYSKPARAAMPPAKA